MKLRSQSQFQHDTIVPLLLGLVPLDSLRLVNKQMQELANLQTTKLCVKSIQEAEDESTLSDLLVQLQNLQSLTIPSTMDDDVFDRICTDHLTHLCYVPAGSSDDVDMFKFPSSIMAMRKLESLVALRCGLRSKSGSLTHLRGCINLTELDLSGNATLRTIAGLEHCRALRDLKLAECGLRPNIHFAPALAGCGATLTKLDLSRNRFLTELCLEHHTALVTLHASGCNLKGGTLAYSLAGCRATLTTLDLSCNNLNTLEGLSHHTALTCLDVTECGLKDDALIPLSNCQGLIALLACGNTLISLEGIEELRLEMLDLVDNTLQRGALFSLSGCKYTLTELRVDENPGLCTFEGLEEHTALTSISAMHSEIDCSALRSLGKCIAGLEHLITDDVYW
jgi:Leucine-rich repeat (LRR) protein